MNLPLIKKMKLIDKINKGKRGISGYMKITKNNYDYFFISSPENMGVS